MESYDGTGRWSLGPLGDLLIRVAALGVIFTPLQEKMSRRACLSLPADETISRLPSVNQKQVSGLSGHGCSRLQNQEKDLLLKPPIHAVLVTAAMTESPPWSTSWKLPLGSELGKQWPLFSFSQGPKSGPPCCIASEEQLIYFICFLFVYDQKA